LEISYKETLDTIKRWYNGYSWDGKTYVYNPFSTLLLFKKKEFDIHWYKTGTPTFLIDQIVKKNGLDRLIGQNASIVSSLSDVDYDRMSSIDLLFQTGYLTIKNKELSKDKSPQYTLDFPNMEVRKAFLSNLLVAYANKETHEIEDISKRVKKALKEKDGEGLKEVLTELYANIPYDLHIGMEKYYHSLFLMIMRLNGYEVEGEAHTDKGRIDAVLKKGNNVIVVEIKYSKEQTTEEMIKEALEQIRDKKYYEKYIGNEVSLLGIAFGKDKEIGCEFQGV
jgi:hypothetical protein